MGSSTSLTRDPSDAATVLSSSSSSTQQPMSQPHSKLPNPDSDSTQNHSDSPVDPEAQDVSSDQPGSTTSEAEADGDQEQEEEEQGECGFCLFMKAGGCREPFIDWEVCIEEAEKNKEDIVEKCAEVTAALKKCMEAHSDYYEPILRAEKAAEQQAIIELERENAKDSDKEGATAASDQK